MTMSYDTREYVIASDSERLFEGDVFYAMFGEYAVRGVVTNIDCDVADAEGCQGYVRDNSARVKLDNGLEGYVTMNGDGQTRGWMNGANHSGLRIPFDTVTLAYMRGVEGWVP